MKNTYPYTHKEDGVHITHISKNDLLFNEDYILVDPIDLGIFTLIEDMMMAPESIVVHDDDKGRAYEYHRNPRMVNNHVWYECEGGLKNLYVVSGIEDEEDRPMSVKNDYSVTYCQY